MGSIGVLCMRFDAENQAKHSEKIACQCTALRTEVREKDPVTFDEDVLWFDVSVTDLGPVNILQCVGETAKEATKQRELVWRVARSIVIFLQVTIANRHHQ